MNEPQFDRWARALSDPASRRQTVRDVASTPDSRTAPGPNSVPAYPQRHIERPMDGATFDTLTRSLRAVGSRRRALAGLLSGAFGLLSAPGEAARKKKPCPPCKTRKKGKCKATLPDGTGCAGGICQGGGCIAVAPLPQPPAPTCSDGIKNGTESDIDCGGSCSRCANGKRCDGRDDCIGALCINNVCTSCSAIGNECFSDTHGACECRNGSIGPVCNSSEPLAEGGSCATCPPGTTTCVADATGIFCFGPCGGG